MKLGIDFDGVLHDYKHPVPNRQMGPPVEGAQEGMALLHKAGHELVIFTHRASRNTSHIEKWLAYYKIRYAYVTAIKENFDLVIDDRAYTFTTWSKLLESPPEGPKPK